LPLHYYSLVPTKIIVIDPDTVLYMQLMQPGRQKMEVEHEGEATHPCPPKLSTKAQQSWSQL